MKQSYHIIMRVLTIGCIIIMCVVGCTSKSISYTLNADELDPMGYAERGYYGKSQEELKKLLPEVKYGAEPSMVLNIKISDTINCKQNFYFYENRLVEIQYIYLFDVGEEAERKFVQLCKRISELDREAQPLGCALPLGEVPIATKVDEIETGFWDKLVEKTVYYPKMIGYATYCDEENSRRVNREVEPEGWDNEYNIKVEAGFYHIDIDRETGERIESNAEFLDGKEARIILTIGTWD